MADGPDRLAKLKEYQALVAQVMAIADKETIEELARVLATHLARYQLRYGALPIEDTLASMSAEAPTDEQVATLAEGMQTLVTVMMLATGVVDDQAGEA